MARTPTPILLAAIQQIRVCHEHILDSLLQDLAMLAAPINSQWSAHRIPLKADFGNANNRSPHLRQTRRWSIL